MGKIITPFLELNCSRIKLFGKHAAQFGQALTKCHRSQGLIHRLGVFSFAIDSTGIPLDAHHRLRNCFVHHTVEASPSFV